MRRLLKVWSLLLALLGGAMSAATAQAMVAGLSIGDLVDKADQVVVGRVSAVQALWSNDGRVIVTQAVVEVDQSLKGDLGRESILVEYLGGEMEDVGLRVSGMPTLGANEQVALFLKGAEAKASAARGLKALVSQQGDGITTYGIVGGAQGKYLLQGGMAAKAGFVSGTGQATASSLSQDDLISMIKEAVADAQAK